MSTLEKHALSRLTQKAKLAGALVVRLSFRPGVSVGFPDTLILRDGKAFFVEVKSEVGEISHVQHVVFDMLETAGFPVHVVYGPDEAAAWVREYLP